MLRSDTTKRYAGRHTGFAVAVVSTFTFAAAPPVYPGARLVGDLPRATNTPPESLPGVDTEYGVLNTSDGAKLRTLVTRPQGRNGRLPAVQFVQWLSCDSIEIAPGAQDGWSRMLRRLLTDSGALVLRSEKSGVGEDRKSTRLNSSH